MHMIAVEDNLPGPFDSLDPLLRMVMRLNAELLIPMSSLDDAGAEIGPL